MEAGRDWPAVMPARMVSIAIRSEKVTNGDGESDAVDSLVWIAWNETKDETRLGRITSLDHAKRINYVMPANVIDFADELSSGALQIQLAVTGSCMRRGSTMFLMDMDPRAVWFHNMIRCYMGGVVDADHCEVCRCCFRADFPDPRPLNFFYKHAHVFLYFSMSSLIDVQI